jgi:hypothetical protein
LHVWERAEVYTGFWWRNLSDGDHLEGPGADGKIKLGWILRQWVGGTDWIDLAQNRDRWWAVENAVMNLRVP